MLVPHFGQDQSQISLEKLMDQAKTRQSQYLKANSGHLLPVIGSAIAVLGLAFILMSAPRSTQQRALEATSFMEQFAAKLADAKTIRPDIARHISRLLRAPEFGCIDVACDAALERRNREVRLKLSTMLTRAASSADVATHGRNTSIIAEAREHSN